MDIPSVLPQTHLRLEAYSKPDHLLTIGSSTTPTRTTVTLFVDGMLVETASGKTLGEALLHLGAFMLGERLLPISRLKNKRLLPISRLKNTLQTSSD